MKTIEGENSFLLFNTTNSKKEINKNFSQFTPFLSNKNFKSLSQEKLIWFNEGE
jgi:hypothetical protein